MAEPNVWDLLEGRQQAQGQAGLGSSWGIDPERQARVNALAGRLGVAPAVVNHDLTWAEQLDKNQRAQAALAQAPKASAWLAEPDNAAVANDTVEHVGLLERTFSGIFNIGGRAPAGGAVEGAGSGVSGLGELTLAIERTIGRITGRPTGWDPNSSFAPGQFDSPYAMRNYGGGNNWDDGAGSPIVRALNPILHPRKSLNNIGQGAVLTGDALKYVGKKIGPDEKDQSFATDVTAAVGQVLGQVALARVAPRSAQTLFVGQGADMMAVRARERGVYGTVEGDVATAGGALVTGLSEKIAVDALLNRIPPRLKSRLLANVFDLGIAGATEAGQEVIEGVAHNALAKGLFDPDQALFEGAGYDATVAGSAAVIVRAMVNAVIPGRAHAMRGEQADRALSSVERMDALVGQVAESPLLQRDPARFADLLDRLADGGDVFIPSETMRSYLQSLPSEEARAEFLQDTGIADQFTAAEAAGADIVMSAGDYLTKIAPTSHALFRDEIRMGLGEMSAKEAEAFRAGEEEAMMEIARRGVDVAVADRKAAAPGAQVEAEVFSQLREAGYTIDASRRYSALYAARYEARGARLGTDALSAFRRSGVSIRAEVGQNLRQRRKVGRVDVVIDALRDRRKNAGGKTGRSLLQFLAKRGGLSDIGGELSAMDADKWHKGKPGQKRLVADGGLALDEAARVAFDNGYFPDRVQTDESEDYYPVTGADLLEAIRDELAGRPRYAVPESQQRSEFGQAVEQLDELLARMGIDPEQKSNADIIKALDAYMADVEGRAYEQPAYHGSPHVFDAFSLDHMGTGEGVQAFGWGLYFAGRKEVADFYRKSLAGYRNLFFDGVDLLNFLEQDADKLREIADAIDIELPTVEGATADQVAKARKSWGWASFARVLNDAKNLITNEKSPTAALNELAESYDREADKELARPDVREAVAEALKGSFARALAKGDRFTVKQPGRLYEVDIPEDGEYLLWDAPLAEQPPAVKAALEAIGVKAPAPPAPIADPTIAGIVRKALAAADGEVDHVEDVIDNDGDLYRRAMAHAEKSGGLLSDVGAGEYVVGLAKAHLDGLRAAKNLTGDNIYNTLKFGVEPTGYNSEGKALFPGTVGLNAPADAARTASLKLRDAGIPGIKYLDGGSRADGEGSYNYVIFDDSRIAVRSYEQSARGDITFGDGEALIRVFQGRDLSTLIHETGHLWLEELQSDAADPFAPDQLRADYATVREWMGLKDGEEIQVVHHEMFARAGEAYFRTGKAPIPSMRDMFQRFRSWLVSIYKRAESLDVKMTPEIREVFDRLIATDEEIEAAKEASWANPFFASAADAGMTDEEFGAYTRAYRNADVIATEKLTVKAMAEVTRRRTKQWREELATVKADVAAEVDSQPEIAALAWLRFGGRLNRQAVVESYGSEAVLARLPRGVPPFVVTDGGLGPDAMAAMFGYDSGDGLLQALMTVEEEQRQLRADGDKRTVRQARIDDEADRVMNERHGDMLADGSIQEEALELVNEDRRADLISSEIRMLARKAGREDGTWTRESLKSWAKGQVSGLKAFELKPNLYLRAERQAGNAAQRALIKGDMDAAMNAKFRQLLNLHLYRATTEAAHMTEQAAKHMARYDNARTIDTMDQDYLDQIHDLLDRVDFRRATMREVRRRENFKAWVEARRAAGEDIDPPTRLMDDAFRQPYQTMTVDELQALFDTIENIAHLGRLKKTLLVYEDERNFDRAADGLFDSIMTRSPKRKVVPPADRPLEAAIDLKDNFFGSHRKMENLARELDGFDNLGPAWRLLYDNINKAGDAKTLELAQVSADVGAMFREYGRVERVRMNLGRTLYRDEVGMSLSKWQVISIALNWGNEGNRDALVEGLHLNHAAIEALLDKAMDERDWRFVQSVWDYLDGFYPRIAALQRKMTGITPERVEPLTFSTRHGVMRGGYYPLKYDTKRSDRAHAHQVADRAKLMMSGGFSKPATRRGFTKERTYSAGQPVRLDINVLFEHLHDVVHDLTHRAAVIDTNRLLDDERVKSAVKAVVGADAHRQMVNWVRDIAGGDVIRTDWLDKSLNYLRSGVTIANMGWKFSTAIVQPMGYSQSIAEVGERFALVGLAKFYGSPLEIKKKTAWILERSPYMAGRIKSFDRDLHDMRKSLGPKGLTAEVEASFFYAIAVMDRGVALPTWIAGYEKGLHDGMDEDSAAEYADSVVRRTQSSGLAKDLSGIQRGGTAQRLFTSFYSYFSATWNMNVDEVEKLGLKGWKYAPRFAANMIWINILPAILTEMVLGRGPDDDEEWWAWAAGRVFGYVGGGLVGVRDIAQGLTSDFGYGGSPTLQVMEEAVNLGKQIQQGEMDRALAKAGTNVLGPALHLPTRQIWITTEATAKTLDGEEVPVQDYLLAPSK